ncbi:MAG: DUF1292 domain-containing protein [Lachnospiraceae bacterium]|jgi:hypothetical protein|nr:DUF1292 domain-containing protein [Lachnospiraceae bacterium]
MEKITFFDQESGMNLEVFVVEQTKLNGENYLLVTEDEEGDSTAYILREQSGQESDELFYEIVEDDALLDALSGIFAEMLEDVDFSF